MIRAAQVTRLSSKGQVVIPQPVRRALGIEEGTELMVFTDGSNLLLKPLELPKREIFKKLIQQSTKWAKEAVIKKSDVAKMIKKVRRASHR